METKPADAGWWWPLTLATMAGLSTTIGAVIAVIRKPSPHTMAGLLGVALGVMATVSILELIIKNAMETDVFLVCASALSGGITYYVLEPLIPKVEEQQQQLISKKSGGSPQPPVPASSHDAERSQDGPRRKAHATAAQLHGGPTWAEVVSRNATAAAAGHGHAPGAAQHADLEDAHMLDASEAGRAGAGNSGMGELPHGMEEHYPWQPAGARGPGGAAVGRLNAAKMLRLGVLMAVTMTLHNLPEGFAVAFSALTDFGPIMAIAIALHNIPEGVIVAAPIFAATGSRWKAVGIATASGLSEPLGALLALAILQPFFTPERLHYLLAFVGGIMLAVCGIELWPEGRNCGHDRGFALGIALGSVVMAWTLYVEG